MNNKTIGITLLVVGIVALIVGLFADSLGLGAVSGFGYKQIIALVVGVVFAIAGYVVMNRK